jgi:hypothetical protein
MAKHVNDMAVDLAGGMNEMERNQEKKKIVN